MSRWMDEAYSDVSKLLIHCKPYSIHTGIIFDNRLDSLSVRYFSNSSIVRWWITWDSITIGDTIPLALNLACALQYSPTCSYGSHCHSHNRVSKERPFTTKPWAAFIVVSVALLPFSSFLQLPLMKNAPWRRWNDTEFPVVGFILTFGPPPYWFVVVLNIWHFTGFGWFGSFHHYCFIGLVYVSFGTAL